MTVTTHKTFCRNCMSSCGIEVDLAGTTIEAIRGDKDHAISQGYICVKGEYSRLLHNGSDRLSRALKRKADGSHAPVATQSALDEIGSKLAAILAQYGPRSVALYYGTGAAYSGLAYSTAKAFLKGIGSPNLFSSATIDQSAKWVAMGRMGAFATGKPSILDMKAMLLVGNNPIISHTGTPISPLPPSNTNAWLRDLRKNGLKVIVMDPRRTETARQADIHLQVRPGQDAVVLASMIKIILDNGWENKAFCARFVTSTSRLQEAVKDFTPEYAAQRSGVPPELIRQAAEAFARSGKAHASSATGPNMAAHSNLSEHLIEALNAICGGYKLAGEPARATGALFGLFSTVEAVIPPYRSWEGEPKMRSSDIGPLLGEYPTSRLPGEILHDGPDRIRALIALGSNPAAAIPDTAKVGKALRSLDLLVAIDPRMTETARLAHYVIPPTLPYEREDLTITSDNWFYKNFAQYTPALLPRPEGTLDDWEVMWELASRLKTGMPLKKPIFGVPYDALPPGVDIDMTQKPTTHEMLDIVCGMSRIPLSVLESQPSGVTLPDDGIIQPAAQDDGARLDVCPDDVFRDIRQVRAAEVAVNTRFPYLLTARRLLKVVNSAFREQPDVGEKHGLAPFFMHPGDIAAEKLTVGDVVKISSAHGTAYGHVTADKGMLQGVVAMPHGWGSADSKDEISSLTGRLVSIDEELEEINFMPLQSGIPVSLTRSDAGLPSKLSRDEYGKPASRAKHVG